MRWPHSGHGFLVPASYDGDSSAFLQRGQLNLIGGPVSPSIVLLVCGFGGGGALASSDASMVLLIGAPAVAGAGGGAAGICMRWPHPGHGFLVPASRAGDSSAFLQRGQLYLMVGPSVSASIVLFVTGSGAACCFMGTSGSTAPA